MYARATTALGVALAASVEHGSGASDPRPGAGLDIHARAAPRWQLFDGTHETQSALVSPELLLPPIRDVHGK